MVLSGGCDVLNAAESAHTLKVHESKSIPPLAFTGLLCISGSGSTCRSTLLACCTLVGR